MNVPKPLLPAGAPSGRARTMKTSASTLEQKCFSPVSRHSSPSWTAVVVFAPTSLPPWRSVRNIPPSHAKSGSRLRSLGTSLVARGLRPVTLDDVGGGPRHPEPAVDRRLGLVDDVRDRGAEHGRHGSARIGLERCEAVSDEVGLRVGPGRVVNHLVHLEAPSVVATELGAVLVGLLGAWCDVLADELPEPGDMLLCELAFFSVREMEVQQVAQVGVDLVPVEAGGLFELCVVGKHALDPTTRRSGP